MQMVFLALFLWPPQPSYKSLQLSASASSFLWGRNRISGCLFSLLIEVLSKSNGDEYKHIISQNMNNITHDGCWHVWICVAITSAFMLDAQRLRLEPEAHTHVPPAHQHHTRIQSPDSVLQGHRPLLASPQNCHWSPVEETVTNEVTPPHGS